MQFDSYSFVLCVLVLVSSQRIWRGSAGLRNFVLLVVSYAFYATWSPLYLPFLLGSTALDFVVAHRIACSVDVRSRRRWLLLSICANLSLLAWFKYAAFFAENATQLMPNMAPQLGTSSWGASFVPLGISFFTFQTLSYTIDVYRRKIPPTDSFVDFALFVSFFPQLIAGPIVRAKEMLPQLRTHRPRKRAAAPLAAQLVVLGLFQKVVLADTIFRPAAERVFDDPHTVASQVDHWLALYAFWGQLYCDFSGYSNLAIGVAACLGFRLPDNFNCPFAATSFAEFWRRWHMTLTRWFGSYVYEPLGGRRCHPLRSCVNVCIVMGVAGLWHGANWTFVLWGLCHASAIICERLWSQFRGRGRLGIASSQTSRLGRALFVFLVVGHSCVLFRAHDLGHAGGFLVDMYTLSSDPSDSVFAGTRSAVVVGTLLGIFGLHWFFRNRDLSKWVQSRALWQVICWHSLMLWAIFMCSHPPSGFLYFQF